MADASRNADEWIAFKKTFTQEQEDALWQYFIDHSHIQPNGYFSVFFYVKNIDDFWRRLYARYNGDFKRYDVLEKGHKQEMLTYYIHKRMSDKIGRVCQRVDGSGTIRERVALWLYRKARNYLFR